ncbi:MAG: malonyl-CoA decarboxylase [Burkholderiales bacterium]|nr:malonyl-CoA decarboxylase [Burkholderiales bacterium]
MLTRLWRGLARHGRTLNEKRGQQWLAQAVETLRSELGESSGVSLARRITERYAALPPEGRLDFLQMLAVRFSTDTPELDAAIRHYAAHPGPAAAQLLHEAAESRRQEVLRRLNFAPSGTAALLHMREDVLEMLPQHPELGEVDADFEHLFRSWFNRGFLQLKRIDWHTPAVVLEKIIRYEAVHEISGWSDLRRRLDPPDRKCFAFFHPTLADDPLIFVEVALTEDIPDAIAPLLADGRPPIDVRAARTAVFYSISNCQKGLRGVSFGNFLIKQVADELKRDFPQLRNFVTLSPVPGFVSWLKRAHPEAPELQAIAQPGWHTDAALAEHLRPRLQALLTSYLFDAKTDLDRPADPVARFHLGNGACIEHVRWLGDVSEKGLRNAAGFMVNYLYDLDNIEANHEAHFKHGTIFASRQVRALREPAQRSD